MAALLETKRNPIAARARGAVRGLLAAAMICCGGAMAADVNLYRAQTVVTGQGEPNRIIGFGACLEDVLIKVSGQPALASDRRLAAYKSKASEFVSGFDYHDQYTGKPHHEHVAGRCDDLVPLREEHQLGGRVPRAVPGPLARPDQGRHGYQ